MTALAHGLGHQLIGFSQAGGYTATNRLRLRIFLMTRDYPAMVMKMGASRLRGCLT